MEKNDIARIEDSVHTLMEAYDSVADESKDLHKKIETEYALWETRTEDWRNSEKGQQELGKILMLEEVMKSITQALYFIEDADMALEDYREDAGENQ